LCVLAQNTLTDSVYIPRINEQCPYDYSVVFLPWNYNSKRCSMDCQTTEFCFSSLTECRSFIFLYLLICCFSLNNLWYAILNWADNCALWIFRNISCGVQTPLLARRVSINEWCMSLWVHIHLQSSWISNILHLKLFVQTPNYA
jgi:hypothetical protein